MLGFFAFMGLVAAAIGLIALGAIADRLERIATALEERKPPAAEGVK